MIGILTWIGYSLCALATKLLMNINPRIRFIEILFIRGIFQAFLYSFAAIVLKLSLFKIPKADFKLCCTRTLFSYMNQMFGWFSFAYLSIGLYSAIQNFSPLLTILLARVLLKESMTRFQICLVLAGFCGVILLVYMQNS